MLRSLMLPLLVLLPACGQPFIDGGWEGAANCGNDAFPLTAVFNEDREGELDGFIYIEGIFGGFIAKGLIENGEYDREDNSYSLQLQTDGDQPPEFDVEMEYADEQFEELEGTVDVLNDDGELQDTCALDLERVSVND